MQYSMQDNLIIRQLELVDYHSTWEAMKAFTEARLPDTSDEIWLLEHPPVFTLGRRGAQEHILDAGDIPVIRVDRGGQVTYHGPGQLVVYLLLDLQRYALGIRSLVALIQDAIMTLLLDYGIDASSRANAPGVYVAGKKVASVGLRVRRGCCYHGLSLNVAMDLSPFKRIHPCGYPGLEVTQISDLGGPADVNYVADRLMHHLAQLLSHETMAAIDPVAVSQSISANNLKTSATR